MYVEVYGDIKYDIHQYVFQLIDYELYLNRDKIFWAPRSAYGPDQGFLKRYLWPWGKWNAMSHDAYTCLQFSRTSPFPTRRKEMQPNNFVAAVVEVNDVMRQECPEKCRPKEHKDWIYC